MIALFLLKLCLSPASPAAPNYHLLNSQRHQDRQPKRPICALFRARYPSKAWWSHITNDGWNKGGMFMNESKVLRDDGYSVIPWGSSIRFASNIVMFFLLYFPTTVVIECRSLLNDRNFVGSLGAAHLMQDTRLPVSAWTARFPNV